MHTDKFSCPHCMVCAIQKWNDVEYRENNMTHALYDLKRSTCTNCQKETLWYKDQIFAPALSPAPYPSEDMPDDVSADFEEARAVVKASPRSAAALLRLATQKLVKHLGAEGQNLNDDIATLVKNGLPPRLQKALDVVRVIGNNAVHPGQLDLKDDQETATAMFDLINMVVDVMITQAKKVEDIYKTIPGSAQQAIQERDKKT